MPSSLRWQQVFVVAAGLATWWQVAGFGFVFDDHPAIVANVALQSYDGFAAAFAPPHQPLANRPATCWSLVLDFAVWGRGPFGPHLGNLLLHLVNALLLRALASRALRAPNLGVDAIAAGRLATAIALLWVVHPLGTDTVAYATQRSTLLASGALLASLLATAHGRTALAALAMAFGMAAKEDLVVGPLLVLCFDRACLRPSWAATAANWRHHAAVAASWIVLVVCVALGPANPTVGYATVLGTTAWQWLLTQAAVLVHYLRLAVWPVGLRAAYDTGITTDFAAALGPALVVLGLGAGTLWLWRRTPALGWLGALFFGWLAPTSSVMPIVTEVVAERRMYLPMLLVVVPAVLLGARLLPARVAPLALAAVVGALGLRSFWHAPVYRDDAALWQHAYAARDPESRSMLAAQILSNHALQLLQQGRAAEAHPLFDLAMQCTAPTPRERVHHAVSLQQRGRHAEAVAALARVLEAAPELAEAHAALGTCLLFEFDRSPGGAADPRLVRAEAALRRAAALEPRVPSHQDLLGCALQRRGAVAAAEAAFRAAIALGAARHEPFFHLADLLLAAGRGSEVGGVLAARLASLPGDVPLRLQAADRLARAGLDDAAAAALQEVLQLQPGHAAAAAALRELSARRKR